MKKKHLKSSSEIEKSLEKIKNHFVYKISFKSELINFVNLKYNFKKYIESH